MPKILIIDDDAQIRVCLEKTLRREGFEVTTAADGQTGLTAALENPDLIICDLSMPGMNGHGVLSALRQDGRMEDVPFIFFSGSTDDGQIRQSMNLGSDDFIPKPAEMSVILDAVNSRLRRHERQKQRQAEELKKAVQIFSGIVDDLGTSEAAIHWLAEAASTSHAGAMPHPAPHPESPLASSATPPAEPARPASFLAIKDNRHFFVKLSEVKVLLAEGEYSRAFWGKDQTMMFRKPLKQWEQELPAQQFVRVHRKAIINLSFLDYVDQTPAGQPQVHLKEFNAAIEVSQRKVSTLNRSIKSLV